MSVLGLRGRLERGVYGIPEIDDYISKIIGNAEPIAMMWPILYPPHSHGHINSSVYAVDAGDTARGLVYGLWQFFEKYDRHNKFYFGFNEFDTEFLEWLETPVKVTGCDSILDCTDLITLGPRTSAPLVSITPTTGHRFVVVRRSPNNAHCQPQQEILVPREYPPLRSLLHPSKIDKSIHLGLVPVSYLDSIESSQRFPRPNLIISRDLAMDPLYYLHRTYDLTNTSTEVIQKAVEERLRRKFKQYTEYAKDSPVVFVFDVHDFSNFGGGQGTWIEFDKDVLDEYFDDVAIIDPRDLDPLYGEDILRGPLFLARAKQRTDG